MTGSLPYVLLLLTLLAGAGLGIAVVWALRVLQAKSAKELARELLRESEVARKAQIEAVLENVKASFGSMSRDALSRSADELTRIVKSKLESEREAAAKEQEVKRSLIDRHLELVTTELANVSGLIKALEGDKTAKFSELATQLKAAREQTAALMQNTAALAGFIETERQRGEEVLRESEERFRAIANASPIPMALCRTTDGVILYVNDQFGPLFGLSQDPTVRRKVAELFHDATERQALLTELKRKGLLANYEARFRKGDGFFWASVSLQPLTFEGMQTQLWGFYDVTDRKLAEDELTKTRGLLATMLESTSDGILVVDRARNVLSYNVKFVEMWRIPESVLTSGNDNQLLTAVLDQLKEPEKFLGKVRQLYAQADAESYDVLEFKDGRLFERYSQPHRIGQETVGRIWSFRDITERKWGEEALEKALRESEEQFRQSQKLEAIGQLAGGIAHDFNNLLTIIAGYSQFLLGSLDPQTPAYQDVDEIRKAAKRAATLTQQLLAFSRKQPRQPIELDINEVVAGLTRMLQRLLGEDIRLDTALAPTPVMVMEDPVQIEQVIMNLAVNARDAMPKGGVLTIETASVEVDPAYSRTHLGTKAGRYVRLLVKDTGVGMDEKTLARCFEPFFTTKPTGQGTGLGLATVYGIVKQRDGAIEIKSQPGKGSAVMIYLPPYEAGAREVPAAVPAARPVPSGTETILEIGRASCRERV